MAECGDKRILESSVVFVVDTGFLVQLDVNDLVGTLGRVASVEDAMATNTSFLEVAKLGRHSGHDA